MILETSIIEQLYCCLFSLVYGMLSGVLYDAFRIFYMCAGIRFSKESLKGASVLNKVLLSVFDVIFSLFVTVGFVILAYAFAYGKFRLVYVLCAVFGALSYMLTLGRLVSFTAELIVKWIKKLLKLILTVLLKPFVLSSRLLVSCFRKMYIRYASPIFRKLSYKRDVSRVERIIKNKLQDYIKL